MKKSLIKIFIVLASIFFGSCSVLAAQLNELKICDYDVLKEDFMEINEDDLIQGKVEIAGNITPASGVDKVAISLDGGETWEDAEGINPFKLSFLPQESEEYPIVIKAYDEAGASVITKVVVVKYISVDLRELLDDIFNRIRFAYMDERLDNFLSFFDFEEYPNFDTFKKNMEDTFDDTSNFNLNISIRSIDLQVEADLAIVRVDWDKTFEDSSSQSGSGNDIHFKKKGGEWKIRYIKDETIFVIGTGTFSGSMTNP